MPKQKTHKGARARLGFTGTGKLLRRKGNLNNYRRKKSRRAKAQFDEMLVLHPSLKRRMRRLLPYGR
ncbi:MAG: 50S ribosomal protein L35 [Chloroflexi bacterium]|nr:50S ribosomal protein L35 [Chloroflexota bacterium]